jgi:class 3 adenylate cyclase/tetratricopeptide (TPR) repeat protein
VSCEACGFVNPLGSRFCGECGTTLAVACPACGAPHEQSQKFCRSCGATLAEDPAASAGMLTAMPSTPSSAPELRFVSVLFVDLVGFTALSEGREAEDVRELLSRYFDVARGVVERYGGTIEKFIGDAVMAVWGAPVALEDDAERAVRAALEIVDAVSVFGVEVGAAELRARAGVVTGQAAAVDNPTEGIVAGDRVNTASRVQSAASPATVLVDEMTRQLTEAAIVFEDAGEHTVKGKVEPLRLWRAVRVVAGVGGRDRERLFEAPFVGRDGELRLLKELLDQTVERSGARLVAVSGDAGIGKSRLRREFSNYTDGLSRRFLWHDGRCLAHGDGVAFWALNEMVRQRLRITEDAASGEVEAKLDAGLSEWILDGEERAYIRPRLGALLGVSTPGLDRAELFAGWRLFLERLAAHDPVVLVFEDMQWADEGLLAFIDQLLDWSRQVPIFILTFARPELAVRHGGWPAGRRGVTTIDLEALTDAATGLLLDGAVDDLPASTRDQIVARAQGNALYAVETLRSLADRGALQLAGDHLRATGEIGELDTPASLGALLAARLDALEPEERELVKAMSVFGGSFPLQAVAALAGIGAGQAPALLDGLVRKQVFTVEADPFAPDRGQYAFAQGLLRSVAYETLSRRTRKQLHIAAAAHLRTAFPDEGEDLAEVIANHVLAAYQASGAQDDDREPLRAEAAAALKRSADRAESVGAPAVACDALVRAAELTSAVERPELLERAGALAYLAAQHERALMLGEQAREHYAAAGRVREAALAERTTLGALRHLGRIGEGTERLQTAIDALTPLAEGPDAGLAELQHILAQTLRFAGQYERADELLDAVLATAELLELHDRLAMALGTRADVYSNHRGWWQQARILYEASLELCDRYDLPTASSTAARGNFAQQSAIWGLPRARELLEQMHEVDRRLGDITNAPISATNLAALYLRQGRWAAAERTVEELLDRGLGEYGMAAVLQPLLILCVLRGDPAGARDRLARLAVFERSGDPYDRAWYASSLVLIAAAEGRHEDAVAQGLALNEEAIRTLGLGSDRPDWDAWPWVLEASVALRDQERVRQVLAVLDQRPPGLLPPQWRAHLIRGQGLLAALDGDLESAEVKLRDAIERFGALEFEYWAAATEVDLADVLIRQDRGPEAEAPLARAVALLEQLGAVPVLERAHGLAMTPEVKLT